MTPEDAATLAKLTHRRRKVLAKMEMLSDSPGASFVVTQKHKAKGQSKAPVSAGGSLYDEWRERVWKDWPVVEDGAEDRDVATALHAAEKFVLQAEAAYDQRTGKLTTRAEEYDQPAIVKDKRILREYEGQPALRVAIREKCSVCSVEILRRMNDRDPAFGKPVRLR